MQLPPVTTVESARLRAARRALRTGAALSKDEPTWLGFLDPNQVRPISGGNNPVRSIRWTWLCHSMTKLMSLHRN